MVDALRRFLTKPLSESLLGDIIRYIVVVFHPNNKLLQSNVVPRWAFLGWLLTCWYVTHHHRATTCSMRLCRYSRARRIFVWRAQSLSKWEVAC